MPTLLRALTLISLALLGGCALMLHPTSSAAELSDADVAIIAETITALVADRIGSGEKVALTASNPAIGDDRLDAHLKTTLDARGYGVQESKAVAETMHSLRYLLTTYARSYLLRVTIDGAEASTLLSRDSGGALIADTPLAVREAVR
jgi:hypothetical protein